MSAGPLPDNRVATAEPLAAAPANASAAVWLTRRWLRRRWAGLVPLAIIVLVGGTATLASLSAAQRTGTAYADYLTRADVGDIVINPGIQSTDIDAVIRDLPDIEAITRGVDLYAEIDGGNGRGAWRESFRDTALQVSGLRDGTHIDMDRPAVHEGRMPTRSAEVLVNVDLANAHDIAIGDELTVTFWRAADIINETSNEHRLVGIEPATVVGIGVFPNEPLPDGVYPRRRALVSADLAERYDCLGTVPAGERSVLEIVAALFPEGCSTVYSRYSVSFHGGDASVAAAQAAYLQAADELNAAMPTDAAEAGFAYFLQGATTAEVRDRVERSTRPTVASITALGVFGGALTLVLAGLAVARELRRADAVQQGWWRLGVGARQRAVVVGAPLALTALCAMLVSAVAAWWLSPVGPVGAVRDVDPAPTREMTAWSWLGLLVVGTGLVLLIIVLTAGWARRMRAGHAPSTRVAPAVVLPTTARPELAFGTRAALSRNNGSGVILGGGIVAIGVFVAAAVFGTSLSSLISNPERYGWPWDAAAVGGLGYGFLDLDTIEATIDDHAEIESWSAVAFSTSITLDGTQVTALIGHDQRGTTDSIVVADGRLPRDAEEIALGRHTARQLDVGIGGTVVLAGSFLEPRPVTVTGLVVLPALGSIAADTTGPGHGMFATGDLLDPGRLDTFATFFGFHAAPGIEPGPLLDDLGLELPSAPGAPDDPAFFYEGPVRPPEIVDATSMQAIPLTVGALMVVAVTVGLSISILVSVRSRRREIATLRSLGFSSRQLRHGVRVHTLLMAVGAMAVGIPLGVLAGRTLWRSFADQLGVLPDPSTPLPLLFGTVTAGVLLALLAAQLPAVVAARSLPADGLRAE